MMAEGGGASGFSRRRIKTSGGATGRCSYASDASLLSMGFIKGPGSTLLSQLASRLCVFPREILPTPVAAHAPSNALQAARVLFNPSWGGHAAAAQKMALASVV